MAQENDGSVAVPLVWVDNQNAPILYANQFIIQHEHDEFLLTVGQMQPPIILGTPEERAEQIKMVSYVSVNMVARIAFNRIRLVALIEALQTNLRTHDERWAGEVNG